MTKKLISVEGINKCFDIHFFLTTDCNYSCPYCIAKERGEEYVTIEDAIKVKNFLVSLLLEYPDKEIFFVLTGGEPTINKDFIEILKIFLSIDNKNLYISVLTNGTILYKMENELRDISKIKTRAKLDFDVSFHYFKEKKDDYNNFIKSFILLKELKFDLALNYLIPYRKSAEFSENLIKKIKSEIGDFYINYVLVSEYSIINEKNPRNHKYTKSHYDLASKNNTKKPRKTILLTFDDNSKQEFTNKDLVVNKYDNFYGWKCYPFRNYTSFMISTKLKVSIAGCHSFAKTNYSLDSILEFMRNKGFYITCGSKICRASMNYGLEKFRQEKFNNNNTEEIIYKIAKKFLIIDGYSFKRLKYINNNYDLFSFMFMYENINNPEIILNIGIEKIFGGDQKYIFIYKDFGIHYFFRKIKGRYERKQQIDFFLDFKRIKSNLILIIEFIIKSS